MIRYLDEVIMPLVLLLPTISRCDETFKDKGKNKNKNNKSMSLCIINNKLLEKYKITWTKT